MPVVFPQPLPPTSLSPANRGMAARITAADGDRACDTALTYSTGGWLVVFVNGVAYRIGNGTKVGCDCYFSGDGGTTARAFGALTAGDFLYWNGTVAGFNLVAIDVIDFVFNV